MDWAREEWELAGTVSGDRQLDLDVVVAHRVPCTRRNFRCSTSVVFVRSFGLGSFLFLLLYLCPRLGFCSSIEGLYLTFQPFFYDFFIRLLECSGTKLFSSCDREKYQAVLGLYQSDSHSASLGLNLCLVSIPKIDVCTRVMHFLVHDLVIGINPPVSILTNK